MRLDMKVDLTLPPNRDGSKLDLRSEGITLQLIVRANGIEPICGEQRMNYDREETYKKYHKRFRDCSLQQLIDAFNSEVDNGGWGSGRACYLSALRDELSHRPVDISVICEDQGLRLSRRVRLDASGTRLVLESSGVTSKCWGLLKMLSRTLFHTSDPDS